MTQIHRTPKKKPGPFAPASPLAEGPGFFARGLVGNERRRGRGAVSNHTGRFEALEKVFADDGWDIYEQLEPFRTFVTQEHAKTIITRNTSPDISFDRSINPYQGCEHGCTYCFARPTHAYYGQSPGLDFETRLFAKPNAAALLRKELAEPGYEVRPIAMGTNTDPYQPIERQHRITRSILKVLHHTSHPVGIVTKSTMILRDLDILSALAARNLVKVAISVTTLDRTLARNMEPRAATPQRRIDAIRKLADAGIPVSVMAAPIIPGLNDHEIENILMSAAAAGATNAGYILLRLPLEVRDLFREWLEDCYPDKAGKVMSLVKQTRGGKSYDATWGRRMRGVGPVAWMIGRRFEIAAKRAGLNKTRTRLRNDLFEVPLERGAQLSLF
ncbi:MAG: PA0069 family radical SAM protein [Fimbriimonadaceae bacterium]|nr:PA0069 family radical SAM protein [Alphaproteobacteria bacterium]